MKSFLKSTLATVLGVFISFIVIFIFFFIMIIAISSSGDEVTVESNSILHLVLDKPIIDRASDSPFEGFNFQKMKPEPKIGLDKLLESIHKAKSDDKITGIYLDAALLNCGLGTINEIRNGLIDFKASGKFILSYSDFYSQRAYYLASVADKIYLTPKGLVEFSGLRAEILFFKNALDKLGIEPQVIRGKNNKFKSAVEPLIADKMSEANRKQTMTYVNAIWDYLVEGIATQRNLEVKDLNQFADEMISVSDPEAAVEKNMIDGLRYEDEVNDELKKLSEIGDKKLRLVRLGDYSKDSEKNRDKFKKEKIAVIYGNGGIYVGEGDEESIGSETLSKAIRKARLDTTVKAIVLRVNSPGGSLLASEIIWREVNLAKDVKPVITSMGNVAASGGYYIAAPSTVIVANPNTITGSIGIFGVIWNAKQLLNKKLGITMDGFSTNTNSGFGSPFRAMSAEEKSILQTLIDKGYDTFKSHVAEGRNMTIEEVDEIGQGRVWSAMDAKEIGLVDEFGGLERAIEIAAEKANLEDYGIISLPEQLNTIQQLMSDLMTKVKVSVLEGELKENYKYYKQLQGLTKMDGIQVRMPYDVELY